MVLRPRLLALLVGALLATVLTVYVGAQALGDRPTRCQRFAADSAARAEQVTGSGRAVLVIGDSYAAGLGLADPAGSWPSRLDGRVRVAGFSGSGFSPGASDCPAVSFAERAPAALAGGADLVVVEGGLNDHDQPAADVRAGFRELVAALAGRRVVVVGPVPAPARADAVPHVDALLARLAVRHGLAYVSTADLDLPYLDDRLHLTPEGHDLLGDAVAERIAALGL